MYTFGYILLSALGVVGVIVSDDVHRFLSCTEIGCMPHILGNELE